jgi:hypothetical protein
MSSLISSDMLSRLQPVTGSFVTVKLYWVYIVISKIIYCNALLNSGIKYDHVMRYFIFWDVTQAYLDSLLEPFRDNLSVKSSTFEQS